MNKRIILSTLVILAGIATAASAAFGQGRYTTTYNRNQVEAFVQQLETSSNAFRDDFRREVNNSGLSASTRRTYNSYANQFENAVDRLRNRFNSNDSWWESRNEVRNMISNSQNLNRVMNSAAFRRRLERQWNQLRNDINRLADTYDLPGLNGGGWMGGGPIGGGPIGGAGSVPAWARGTFYGRNPQTGGTIRLDINANGSVLISTDGSTPTYASIYRTTMTNGPYVSRLSRISNGIRTTDVNNGSYIDYFRTPVGGGVYPPYPSPGQGDVPSWAVGTFYGRNPQTGGTISLRIQRNGTVEISTDGSAPTYGTMNGTTLTNGPYVSRVTRIRNGIRTTDVNNGSYIDYYIR
ncbi:MAG TPA: hypothetical protein VFZ23_02815 [Pyrinomonadaceae bacterium]